MHNLPSCADYSTSIVVNTLVKPQILMNGSPEMFNGRPIKYTGGFCIVFPYTSQSNKYAVRCWHAYLKGAEERTRKIAKALREVNLPYFVGFEYFSEGIITPQGIQPVVVMDWVDAKPLKKYIADYIDDSYAIKKLADNFARMVKDLHEHNLSHGDLQHGNIMVKKDGSLILVDYDSMYVPELDGWTDEISGLAGYQHPARWSSKKLSPKSDYFSELIIYTSLIALAETPSLWQDLMIAETDTMLFTVEDIKSGGTTPIFTVLETMSSCSNLCVTIKEFLSRKTIDDLEPLENVTISYLDKLKEIWKDNGYKPDPAYNKSDVTKITEKW